MTILDRVREDLAEKEEEKKYIFSNDFYEMLKEDYLLKQAMFNEMSKKNEELEKEKWVYNKCIYPFNEIYYG